MAQTIMYPAKAGSPQTTTTAILLSTDTSVYVSELSCFPAVGTTEGGGLLTLWSDKDTWETCLYSAKSSASGAGYLTIARTGAGHASSTGGAIEWENGTTIARNLTAYDHTAIKANIEEHQTVIAGHTSSISDLSGRMSTAESAIDSAEVAIVALQSLDARTIAGIYG